MHDMHHLLDLFLSSDPDIVSNVQVIDTYSPYYKKGMELLEKFQCRFTKMITNVEGLSYEDRLRCLNLWSLEERRHR